MVRLIKSFVWAMNGLRTVWQEEANFRTETYIAVSAVVLGVWLKFSAFEWMILILCIIAVLAAEIVNTAIEDLCDRVEPAHDPVVAKIKDIMAGFVLLVSVGALIIGVILFIR